MARLFLLIAGLCKIARAIGLKFTGCLARFFTNNRRSRRYGGQYWFSDSPLSRFRSVRRVVPTPIGTISI